MKNITGSSVANVRSVDKSNMIKHSGSSQDPGCMVYFSLP